MTRLQCRGRGAIPPPAMATFCLIHGQWHDGSSWDAVAGLLRARGHEVVAPDLPFDDPGATHEHRARAALDALEGSPDPLVVVGHSAGSGDATLVGAERRAALVVYLCPRFGSFEPPPGAPSAFREGFPFPPQDAEGRGVWEPRAAVEAMYPRLAPETARDLAARLRPGAAPADAFPLDRHPAIPAAPPPPPPPDTPAALVYPVEDDFSTRKWEPSAARKSLGVEPIELPGGHF